MLWHPHFLLDKGLLGISRVIIKSTIMMHFLPFIIQGQCSSLITHFCRKSMGGDSLGMWLFCCNTSARVRHHCFRAAVREIYPLSQEGKHHPEMQTPLFIAFCVSRFIIRVFRNTFPGLSSFLHLGLGCMFTAGFSQRGFLPIYYYFFLRRPSPSNQSKMYQMSEEVIPPRRKRRIFLLPTTTPNFPALFLSYHHSLLLIKIKKK